jgi:hypothetical protein
VSIVVDTNVLSELLRNVPAQPVLDWFAGRRRSELFVSAVTHAEMITGAAALPAGKRRLALERALAGVFGEDFAGRILPFDEAAVPHYAAVQVARRRSGRPISQFDCQIAAIALANGMQLATRNTADFEGCGLALVDPWR